MSTQTFTIDKMSPGDFAVVDHIEKTALSDRLTSLGLVPETAVKCLHLAPFGDPVAYAVRGAVIALRREDSRQIHVRTGGSPDG